MRTLRGKILTNIDWISVLIVFFLMLIGWTNIYSTVYEPQVQSIFDLTTRSGKQLLWIIITIPIAAVIFIIDSKFYSVFAYVFYTAGILLLIAVLFFGIEVNATKAWFDLGGFRFQPSEFVKFMLTLAIAQLLTNRNFSFNKISSLLRLMLLFGIPVFLIFLQHDHGTTIVYFFMILVLYREGLNGGLFFTSFALVALFILALIIDTVPLLMVIGFIVLVALFIFSKKHKNSKIILISYIFITITLVYLIFISEIISRPMLAVLIGMSVMAIIMIIMYFINRQLIIPGFLAILIASSLYVFSVDYVFDNFLQPHQQHRINVLLGKTHDPLGSGYNLNQSKIAIAAGGFYGKGFMQGPQTKYNFVPEQSTDFIFCTVGEEWGLIGTTTVMLLYLTLILRIIFLAERQRSPFSRIYGYGAASILFAHIFINIGMTVGIVPVMGIPLPFLSYGGSSLWAFTILVFIFLKLDSDRLQIFR